MDKRLKRVPISPKLDSTINHCLKQLKKEQRAKRKRRINRAFMATAAAVLCCTLFLGILYPDMTENIPFLRQLAGFVHNGDGRAADKYTQKSNGITITVSEMYHDYQAMYMTVTLHNSKRFSEDMVQDARQQYSGKFELLSEVHYDFCDKPVTSPSYMEGSFTDNNTFTGKVKMPLKEMPLSDANGSRGIPRKFDINWTVHIIYDWPLLLWDYVNAKDNMNIDNFVPPCGYNGDWNFYFNVEPGKAKK